MCPPFKSKPNQGPNRADYTASAGGFLTECCPVDTDAGHDSENIRMAHGAFIKSPLATTNPPNNAFAMDR
jgi:hypothetical protein